MFKLNTDPLLVVVKDGRWDAFGPNTLRSQYLYKVLSYTGGVNESVPEGRYHFNVKLEGFKILTTLTPVKE